MPDIRKILYHIKALLRQTKLSIRAKIPEKVIITATYVANIILIFLQLFLLRDIGESTALIQIVDFIVALQLIVPYLLLDVIPLFHYFMLLGLIATGSFLNLVLFFPIYYYTLTFVTILVVIKLEPVLTTSPTVVKITTKVKRAAKKARVPKTIEEFKFSLKLCTIHIVSIVVSLIIFFIKQYSPAILVTTYASVALIFFMLNIGANPLVKIPKTKYSLTLLFVLRYPFLFRIANKMKMKIHPLTERAGILIYELEYVSKYLAVFMWYLMLLPTIFLVLYVSLPWIFFVVSLPFTLMLPVFMYYMPFISLSSKARARKAGVEKEYPIFLAYASALVSAGYSIYAVFKDLATGKGSELLKAFTKEAKYFIALIDKQGLPEIRALERYATTHPSSEFRNFILGYMHQKQLGGRISFYMEQKLMEALDALKRRMENYVNQIVLLTEIALTVLVIPTLPMVIGFIIAPDIVYNMLFMQVFLFIPAIGFMFYSVASGIQMEFRDEYRFTYIPSVVAGVLGLFLALILAHQKLISGVAFIIGAIALGYYIEYVKQKRVFSEIEKTLPQIFRDLSELRHMMPISEALGRMTKMGYPKSVIRILRRVVALREHGVRLSEQPWHSRSWFWKFTQFLLGKIEESGGGTVELFRQLMLFFTEFNNIMSSVRGSLRIYEFVIYAIPAIFGLVTYSTLGIFVAMTEVSKTMGLSSMNPAAMSQLGAQFPQLMRIFQGIDPMVLLINDVIIFEMSFILGLLGGKIISGTIRDTRALAISMIVAALVIVLAPQFVQSLIQQSIPVFTANTTIQTTP